MPTTEKTDRDLAVIQLTAAETDALSDDVIERGGKNYVILKGKAFQVADSLGALSLLKWAAAADLEEDDPAALGAVYSMLQSIIDDSAWREFERHANKTRAEIEDLIKVISGGMEVLTGNPTEPPSGSGGTSTSSSGTSKGNSSSKRAKG